MAYFLKKTKNKKGTYLQIYLSFYDPARGHAAHKSFKPIGYVHELIEQGIENPVSHFKDEVNRLNLEFNTSQDNKKTKLISDESPEKFLGYFPLKSINDSLGVKPHFDILKSSYGIDYDAFEILEALVYSRIVKPCSKRKTFYEVVPQLFNKFSFSKSQMYNAIEFYGQEYQKIIQIYNHFVQSHFDLDNSINYFDCTNFYFEIDREDNLRRKGPSKENKREPIVGMGLLLDKNQIPIGMNIYPGNESEKPKLDEVINDIKNSQDIKGKTIRVADKGLNSAKNIVSALNKGDGYIFSKSVRQLPQIEKKWVLSENDYEKVCNAQGEILYLKKSCVDDFPYTIDTVDGKKKTVLLKEKRVVVYSPKLARKKRQEIYKQVDKAKKLRASEAKKSEYGDSSKYVTFESIDTSGNTTNKKVKVTLNEKSINEALSLAGFNLFVTSEVEFDDQYICETYHNIWRIEESFKVMKSYLDARPIFHQKEDSIKGHFTICYLSVLLMRLFQFKVLDNCYSSEELIKFFRDLRVIKVSSNQYINISKSSEFIKDISSKTKLPLQSYYLNNTQIKKVLKYRF